MTVGHVTRTRRPPQRKGGGMITLLMLAAPVSLFVLPTALLMVVGLVPTVVAYIVDRDPEKTAPIAVGAINVCGVLPFLMDMWKHQHTVQKAMQLLGDPLTWLVMYASAALGWFFFYFIPPIVTNIELMRLEARITSLQNTRRDLAEEWGSDVALDDEALLSLRAKGDAKSV